MMLARREEEEEEEKDEYEDGVKVDLMTGIGLRAPWLLSWVGGIC